VPHTLCKTSTGDNILFFTEFKLAKIEVKLKYLDILKYRSTVNGVIAYACSLVPSKSIDKVRCYHHYGVNIDASPMKMVKLLPSWVIGIEDDRIEDEDCILQFVR
jgi:hypothetical protein